MLRGLRTFPLLDGYRGAPRADVGRARGRAPARRRAGRRPPEIAELDCNPVVVSPGGAVVVDARVRVAPAAPPPPFPALGA